MIEDAKASLAFTQEMIDDTTREIAFLRVNKTTRDMSTNDMKEVYPDIAEEVEEEIENREWFITWGKREFGFKPRLELEDHVEA